MRGADKLAMHVAGAPLLRLVAERALAASSHVAVSLATVDTARRSLLCGLDVELLPVPEASEGMAASLRAGALWAENLGASALMIALPDMPEITSSDMRALIDAQAARPDQPLRASTQEGAPGHPVILPRRLFGEVRTLRGDSGARALLRAHPPLLHPLEGARAITDLDTPEDWAAWRRKGEV